MPARALTDPEPARRPRAPATRRAQRDFLAFRAWCAGAGHDFLPTSAAALEDYVAELAAKRARGTIDHHLAAIAAAHRARGLSPPGDDPAVRRRLRALKPPVDPHRKRPTPGPEKLARMAGACPRDPAGLRDRALLLLAASGVATPAARADRAGGGFSRAALVGLDAEHVRFTPAGADLLLPGAGARVVSLARRPACCPVAALRDWMQASDCAFGPVFRKVDRTGRVEQQRLGTDAIRRILRRRTLTRGRQAAAP